MISFAAGNEWQKQRQTLYRDYHVQTWFSDTKSWCGQNGSTCSACPNRSIPFSHLVFSVLCKFFVGAGGEGYEHLVVVVVLSVIVCIGYHYTLLIMAQNVMGTEFWVGWIFFFLIFSKIWNTFTLYRLPVHSLMPVQSYQRTDWVSMVSIKDWEQPFGDTGSGMPFTLDSITILKDIS